MSQGLVTLNGYKWGTAPFLFHSCQIHGEVNILKVSIEMSALWIDLVDKSISLAGHHNASLDSRDAKPETRWERIIPKEGGFDQSEQQEGKNEILSSFYSKLN